MLVVPRVLGEDLPQVIRYQYLSQLGDSEDLQVGLLHRMAVDIAGQCGHTLLKAHRLAWGWTVTEAVDAFHQMCRGENIKPRGLVARSWLDWEAGSRPNWDYQDLLSRLFHTSPVRLGWAAGYTPAGPAGFLRELGVDGTDIPEGLDERARSYRARLAGRRMLVVLDNAADEAQVRPLLPGSPGCAVLVTSTSRMAALAGAAAVPLGLMLPGQAAGLVTGRALPL